VADADHGVDGGVDDGVDDGVDGGVDHGVEPASHRANPDELAELEEERRFLLRSLADLDREREAGDVDDADYAALRDGYTSRAAAVLRSIDAGRSRLVTKPPRNLRRIAIATAGTVAVAAGLIVLVLQFAAPRASNDTITGGTDSDRIAALLSDGRRFLSGNNYSAAANAYQQVLDTKPDNVEARAYLGWVLANAAQAQTDDAAVAETLQTGKATIEEAIDADPTYADSYCFLSIIAAYFEADVPTATSRRAECLDRDPSSDMQALIDDIATPIIDGAVDPGVGTPVSIAPVTQTTG